MSKKTITFIVMLLLVIQGIIIMKLVITIDPKNMLTFSKYTFFSFDSDTVNFYRGSCLKIMG